VITGARPGAEVAAQRLTFERELVGRALAAGKPLLGICRGMQVIGECLGGTVAKDLPGMNAAVTPHIPSSIPDEFAHDILIEPDSDVFAWHREGVAKVNSLHRHALMDDGRFRVSARATDGLIEAFEGVAEGFCLGVQWHPEYRLTRLDRTILAAFIRRCAGVNPLQMA
jgi:gamma-glutamyl-gamma-aminobutyrate hydrolase PuuD